MPEDLTLHLGAGTTDNDCSKMHSSREREGTLIHCVHCVDLDNVSLDSFLLFWKI